MYSQSVGTGDEKRSVYVNTYTNTFFSDSSFLRKCPLRQYGAFLLKFKYFETLFLTFFNNSQIILDFVASILMIDFSLKLQCSSCHHTDPLSHSWLNYPTAKLEAHLVQSRAFLYHVHFRFVTNRSFFKNLETSESFNIGQCHFNSTKTLLRQDLTR